MLRDGRQVEDRQNSGVQNRIVEKRMEGQNCSDGACWTGEGGLVQAP